MDFLFCGYSVYSDGNKTEYGVVREIEVEDEGICTL